MQRRNDYRTAMVMAASLAAGCAVEYRDHHDYHRWDHREDRAYHRYFSELSLRAASALPAVLAAQS